MQIVIRKISDLKPADYNPRKKSPHVLATVQDSLKSNGWLAPVVVNKNPDRLDVIVGGHRRLEAATANGESEVPTIEVNLTLEQEKRLNLQLNAQEQFDQKGLAGLIAEMHEADPQSTATLGFSQKAIADYLYAARYNKGSANGVLAEKFLIPPFSVLDSKQGYWTDRKAKWLEVIGDRKETRTGKLAKGEGNTLMQFGGGVSSFDPVLVEVCYSWFAPKGGRIIDPFAGGPTAGIVAGTLGHQFTGVEVRHEQVEANRKTIESAGLGELVRYVEGNSKNIPTLIAPDEKADLIFSCPPYYDLEVYSDGAAGDLSAKQTYEEFMADYESIFRAATEHLNDNRFAIVVLGDIRDERGFYRNFLRDNIGVFERLGYRLYNEIIYLQALATAPHRAERNMRKRKTVKVHQNIYTFYKGSEEYIRNPQLLDIHHKVMAFYRGDPDAIPVDFTNPPPIERNLGALAAEVDAPDELSSEDRT